MKECDFDMFGTFHYKMLERNVYFPPSQYEAVFLSNALNDVEVQRVISGIVDVVEELFAQ